MKPSIEKTSVLIAWLAIATVAVAGPAENKAPEDANAATQYHQLNLTTDPSAALGGKYKLDPHHTSVVAKLAHMDLSRYTLRFDEVAGNFDFDPSKALVSGLSIDINPGSVDTGDATFDKRIASRYFEAEKFPFIRFTAESTKIVNGSVSVNGTLDFHGVKKPVVLVAIYRGFAQSRMGFSGEASFRRSEFGVGQWVPLEADQVTILVETEFVRQ